MLGYVYILKSLKNNSYYIGSTNDVIRRFQEHSSGKTPSLRHILPLELIFSQQFSTVIEARKMEYKLKRFKNKNIIESIIRDGYIKIKV